MFLHVEKVQHIENYILRITFNSGDVKLVDLASELYGPVFEPLVDSQFFKKVRVNPETNTIEWPNGADFAPEFLFEIGERENAELLVM